MAEEKIELRDLSFRHLLPWTEIFRSFQVALDPRKLLLAAAGLVVMSLGWWLLAIIFSSSATRPDLSMAEYASKNFRPKDASDQEAAAQIGDALSWKKFKEDRLQYNLLYKAAGRAPELTDAGDLADSRDEYKQIEDAINKGKTDFVIKTDSGTDRRITLAQKPYGKLRTWPWDENRGPNPFLVVTGQESYNAENIASSQIPLMLEPLVKFLRPVVYLLSPHRSFREWSYFVLVILWTLATWALFGGAITRMVAVQVARREKIDMGEALKFSIKHYLSYLSAPMFPLLFVLLLTVALIVFGLFHLIPAFGDIVVDGIGFPIVLIIATVMAVLLVGLVGWPMMYATISSEGSDSFDALSRSYSYVYQCPWHYLWYSFVAIVYGGVLVFFVALMGSLMVYLGKWGLSQTPFAAAANREPSYLFVYAPESYHWREMLLQGSKAETAAGAVDTSVLTKDFYFWNYVGAILVAMWLYLVFLMVVGFSYSYFWTATTIIYLLMRREVEDTDMDEVYMEEEEMEEGYTPPAPPAAEKPQMTMVESPTLRTPASSASPAGNPESASSVKGDGEPPAPAGTA